MMSDVKCATCGNEASVASLTESELKRLRIETTKQMILDRLEMEERPKFKNKTDSGGGVIWTPLEEAVDASRQIIIFPTKILPVRRGASSGSAASSVLKFPVTDEMLDVALQSAVLWTAAADNTSRGDLHQTFYNQIQQHYSLNRFAVAVSWEPSDVTSVVNAQIERVNRSNGLKKKKKSYLSLPIADRLFLFNEPKPYLIIQLDSMHLVISTIS